MPTDKQLAPGQVWTIDDAPTPQTRLTIGRLEPFGLDTAVHVAVTDIGEIRSTSGKMVSGQMGHLPFSYNALASSLDTLIQENAPIPPSIAAGYTEWQNVKAGIFTQGAAETVNFIRGGLAAAQAQEKKS